MRKGKRITWSKVWTGSIIAAFAAAVGIFGVMLQMEKKILSEYERSSIFVAVKEIPKGQTITEENYGEYLCLRELDQGCVPSTALKSQAQLDNLVAKETIEEGVLLTTGMFEARNSITEQMQQPVVIGFKAEDLYQVVGGVLRAGDRIHIYTVAESGQASLIWREVFVEQVFDSGGNVIAGGDTSSAAQRINIYLDAEDVEQFYTELALGTLRVAKVCE
jgi:hypothetical protein